MSSFSSKKIKITPELEKYINNLIGHTELGEKKAKDMLWYLVMKEQELKQQKKKL